MSQESYAFNIHAEAALNNNYRKSLWTGEHLQMTLMSIPVGDDVGLEIHDDVDQFIRVESGYALVKVGPTKYQESNEWVLCEGDGVFVAAKTWHNIINISDKVLKLSSVYAPPHHPQDTIEPTKV